MGDTKRQSAARSQRYRANQRTGGATGRRMGMGREGRAPGGEPEPATPEGVMAQIHALRAEAAQASAAARQAGLEAQRRADELAALDSMRPPGDPAGAARLREGREAARVATEESMRRWSAAEDHWRAIQDRLRPMEEAEMRRNMAALTVAVRERNEARVRENERLAAADRAAGGPGVALSYFSPEARTSARTLLGDRATSRTFATITGARAGDTIRVTDFQDRDYTSAVAVLREGADGGKAEYVLGRNHDGALVMQVGYVTSGAKSAQSGRELLDGVRALRSLGVTRITAEAAGNRHDARYNGYYTWAVLGGTGLIRGSELREAARRAFNDPSIDRVEQVLDKPGGRAWWKEHGQAFDMTLDLRPGGRAGAVIDRLAARGGREKGREKEAF